MDRKRKFDAVENNDEPSDSIPDRTMSDFYCKICDSHMNSEQMWESHISGKRHMKNVKKKPGEMPSKVRAIKVVANPFLIGAIKDVHDPIVGLNYMTELQRSDPGLNPSYTCHLCQAYCTWSVIIDHILLTKHRLAYIKAVDPEQYQIIEQMELKKTALDSLVEDRALAYEQKYGSGKPEVKLEKPKMTIPLVPTSQHQSPSSGETGLPEYYNRSIKSPPRSRRGSPPRSHHHYSPPRSRRHHSPLQSCHSSPSQSSLLPHRHIRSSPPVNGKWRHDRFSPESGSASPPSSYDSPARGSLRMMDFKSMASSEKLTFVSMLSKKIVVTSDAEVKDVKAIVNCLLKSFILYRLRQLPIDVQNRLAKHIYRHDLRNFELELRPTLEYFFGGAVNAVTHNTRLSSQSEFLKYFKGL